MVTVPVAAFAASPQLQPFPMQGSKRAQVPIINQLVPGGQPRLIEPFCGSAAVSVGARRAGLVGEVLIADVNGCIVRLWREIIDDPRGLADRYATIWGQQFRSDELNPKQYFDKVRARYNAGSEDAAEFLFLLNRIVKAALRYSQSGVMNQSADGRRTGAKPSTVRQRLMASANAMNGARVERQDWLTSLEEATVSDVIYLDPPYQGTTNTLDKRYVSGMAVVDFENGVRAAVDRDLSLIISYDALRGPAIYGRPLDPAMGLLALDIVTGVSAQGTLLGRKTEAHETIYVSPALVKRLGGTRAVINRVSVPPCSQQPLALAA